MTMSLPSLPSPQPWSCAELRRQAALVAAGELPPADARLAQAHLDACAGCRRCVAHERAFLARLHRVRDRGAAPASLRARIAAVLARGGRSDS